MEWFEVSAQQLKAHLPLLPQLYPGGSGNTALGREVTGGFVLSALGPGGDGTAAEPSWTLLTQGEGGHETPSLSIISESRLKLLDPPVTGSVLSSAGEEPCGLGGLPRR